MLSQCLKFKTYSSIFLNRFEALNLSMIEKMQNRQRPVEPELPVQPAPGGDSNAPTAATSSTIPQAPGPKTGGVKKKKGKKK